MFSLVRTHDSVNSRTAIALEDFHKYETPFEIACRVHEDQLTTLTLQRRMHSEIAALVRTLFYRDQIWTNRREKAGRGLRWIDTSGLSGRAHRERDGTSSYNNEELDSVHELVRQLIAVRADELEEILIISPYQAQVARLVARFEGVPGVKVRTIDGCQGIEANTVIVSFVSFRFTLESDFVVDPKRMNVALSRARDALFLVGNLTEAKHSIESLKNASDYPHIIELINLFSSGGEFGGKAIVPTDVKQVSL
jgi:superfamily I DNA and/or RNA helicase